MTFANVAISLLALLAFGVVGWALAKVVRAQLRRELFAVDARGSKNIINFGAVASVIEAHFDLLGLIEVMQKGGGHPGYDRLLQVLGAEWHGLISETPRPNKGGPSQPFVSREVNGHPTACRQLIRYTGLPGYTC